MSLWHRHPGVRSGSDLSLGERAADSVRSGMGSWPFMGAATVFLVVWMATGAFGWDRSPFFRLNLLLSCFAALQGAILLIAAKRADQVASEVAVHTSGNTDELMQLNRAQMQILSRLDGLDGKVADLAEAVAAVMALRKDRDEAAPGLSDVLAEVRAVRALVTSTQPLAAADKPAPKPRGSRM